jgi:hypothetical protein
MQSESYSGDRTLNEQPAGSAFASDGLSAVE